VVLGPDITRDALLGGAIELVQPRTGYRVNVDSILLAAFATGRRAALAVDLGSGVGAVALLAHHHGLARELALVEREPELAELARQNLERAGADGRVFVRDLDGSGLPIELRGKAGLVLSNPPFFNETEHRPPKSPARKLARLGGVAPFLRAASLALSGDKARAAFVYPARGLEGLLAAARGASLVPKRLRFVHAYAGKPARLALVELRRAKPGGLVVEPPLVEWERPGRRSAELLRLTAGASGRS
jgi:tRNA1Val (adenine37-N6)-methyltransferase